MAFAPALVLGIIIGFLRGGNFRNIGETPFHYAELIFLAFMIRYGLYYASASGWWFLIPYIPAIQVFAYSILLFTIWRNRHLGGALTMGLGAFLNLLVIAINDWRMPVSREGVVATGQQYLLPGLESGEEFVHALVTDHTRLVWLGDILYIPGWEAAKLFSLGDVLIVLGIFFIIQHLMGAGRRPFDRLMN